MKFDTDAVLVVFWRWAKMALRWRRPVGRSMCERRRHKEGATQVYVAV